MTAQRVAAYRLGFSRLAVPIDDGDPDADDRLAADAADGVVVDHGSRMGRHLQARSRFFDRVTVNALEGNVTQIIVVGGRLRRPHLPLRRARGVLWRLRRRRAASSFGQLRSARRSRAVKAATWLPPRTQRASARWRS